MGWEEGGEEVVGWETSFDFQFRAALRDLYTVEGMDGSDGITDNIEDPRMIRLAYSKFLVQIAFRNPLESRYSISSSNPGCGFCRAMAALSMAWILAKAWVCAGSGRAWMWSRMSDVGGMLTSVLWGRLGVRWRMFSWVSAVGWGVCGCFLRAGRWGGATAFA